LKLENIFNLVININFTPKVKTLQVFELAGVYPRITWRYNPSFAWPTWELELELAGVYPMITWRYNPSSAWPT